MDRSEAATTLLAWQVEGEDWRGSPRTDEGDLIALAISLAARPPRPPRPARRLPPPPVDFLDLEEERAVAALRARLRALASVVRDGDRRRLESQLQDLMPAGRIRAIHEELDRLARRSVQRGFDALLAPAPPALRAVLLFSKDGRLLAVEGQVDALDLAAIAALVARADPGATWSLAYRDGLLTGHVGQRAALLVLHDGRPPPGVGGTLRAALASLEQGNRLASALTHPSSHQALTAYVRAVRTLLTKGGA